MKFKDAKLDMKVISDGPLKIKGTIVAIDDKYRNVRVKGERVTLWFFEKPNEPDSEYDLAYLKVDPKAKLVGNPPKKSPLLICHKSSVGVLSLKDISFETARRAEYQADQLIAKYAIGIGGLRPESTFMGVISNPA